MASDFFMFELNHSSDHEATIVLGVSSMFTTMVDYAERLTWAMTAAGYDVRRLADAIGATYQAVKKVVDGKSTAFSAVNNTKVARLLHVNSDWLATGEGPRHADATMAWPFADIAIERIQALEPDDRIEVQADLLHALERVERRTAKKPALHKGNKAA